MCTTQQAAQQNSHELPDETGGAEGRWLSSPQDQDRALMPTFVVAKLCNEIELTSVLNAAVTQVYMRVRTATIQVDEGEHPEDRRQTSHVHQAAGLLRSGATREDVNWIFTPRCERAALI